MKESNGTRTGILAVGIALAVSFGLAACGGGVETADVENIFQDETEAFLEAGELDITVESVSCPDDISSDEGTTFDCSAELSDGDTLNATGEVGATEGDEASITFDPASFEFESLNEGGGEESGAGGSG